MNMTVSDSCDVQAVRIVVVSHNFCLIFLTSHISFYKYTINIATQLDVAKKITNVRPLPQLVYVQYVFMYFHLTIRGLSIYNIPQR